jgi:hypothetical protein
MKLNAANVARYTRKELVIVVGFIVNVARRFVVIVVLTTLEIWKYQRMMTRLNIGAVKSVKIADYKGVQCVFKTITP